MNSPLFESSVLILEFIQIYEFASEKSQWLNLQLNDNHLNLIELRRYLDSRYNFLCNNYYLQLHSVMLKPYELRCTYLRIMHPLVRRSYLTGRLLLSQFTPPTAAYYVALLQHYAVLCCCYYAKPASKR